MTHAIRRKRRSLTVRLRCFGDTEKVMVQESWLKIDSNLNSVKYIQLLQEKFIPDMDESEIFQHHGDPCYISFATRQSLDDESITVLKDWTAQIADLNMIE